MSLTDPNNRPIAVVVGILFDEDDNVLLCQRPKEKSYPLQWEFPGGKVEKKENVEQALRRELREELGIVAKIGEPLLQTTSGYSDGNVYSLYYFAVRDWEGSIINEEFADIVWSSPSDIDKLDTLQGNTEIISLLQQNAANR